MLKIINQYSTRPIMLGFLLILTFLVANTAAQETLTGTWKAKVKSKDGDKVHISFYRDSEGKRRNQVGTGFKFEDLTGLSKSQALGAKSNVSFSVNREPGNIALNGAFENGKGSGNWTFTSNPAFVSEMKSQGFDGISTRKLFTAAVLDVKTQTVRDIKAAGLTGLDFDDVFKAAIFKIDSAYIKEMNGAGFPNLDMEDLVKARIFKIDAAYAKEVLAMGFGDKSLEELVKFRIFKVTPEFLTEMKGAGLQNLDAGDIVQLRIFKINSKFVEAARAKGYKNPSVEELVELKIHGKVK